MCAEMEELPLRGTQLFARENEIQSVFWKSDEKSRGGMQVFKAQPETTEPGGPAERDSAESRKGTR